MPVNIRGKEYKTVAERVHEFRSDFTDHAILTEIVSSADLVQVKAVIEDKNGRVIATGFAEEVRGSTNINKTSALENCETSAIGRALANFGLSGTEFASADEVANAIAQQAEIDQKKAYSDGKKAGVEYYTCHMECVKRHWDSLVFMRQQIALGNNEAALEAWEEIPHEDQQGLWVAPTKGGFFSIEERNVIQPKTASKAA